MSEPTAKPAATRSTGAYSFGRRCAERADGKRSHATSCKGPAMFARLAARAWRNVPLPPTDPAAAITHLDNDWFKCCERLVGENIWLDQAAM
jgi:hypothetical protein